MATKQPPEIAEAAVDTGVKKAHLRWDKVLVGGFLAGAYIAFGGLVAITVSSGLDPATWGTLPTLFMGAAFTLGLVLVVIAGSHLATGNMMLVPLGAMNGKLDRKSTRLNSSHANISYAVFCLKKKYHYTKSTLLNSNHSI